jgi:hypothetical protein
MSIVCRAKDNPNGALLSKKRRRDFTPWDDGPSSERVSTPPLPPYNVLMVTKILVLAMVLAISLVVPSPAVAGTDFATAKPIPGYPDYEITDNGNLVYGGDTIEGKCGGVEGFDFLTKSLNEEAARACKAAGYPTSLAKTGGLPIILVPVALLVLGGLLIRKSTAL